MKMRIFSSIFVISILFSGFLYGAIPAQERNALIAFYNATNGDSWTENSGWKTPPLNADGFAMPGTEGTWFGVTVSGDHVTEIILEDNQLSGNIPPELGNLSNLAHLDLFINQLSGSIPPELGNLSNLKFIRLFVNQLSGSIPPELGNLSNLTQLNLASNQLSGSIPPELGNLSNLTLLWLAANQLSGSIPPELGNLSKLDNFRLNSNQLSGSIPTWLGSLSNLIVLGLGSNQLSGSIPPELGNLSNLYHLWLNSNQLSGSIPPELGNLSNLTTLHLFENQLSGSIPPELGNLSNLELLWLFSNPLSGSIPPELGNLSNLRDLFLESNQLSGSIPSELGNLSNLEILYLPSNQLSGSIPPELGNLGNLRILWLASNHLSGSIPLELGNLSKLEYLGLHSNQLSRSIPTSLTNLSNLLSSDNNTDIGYNGLFTNDETLRTFLNSKDPDWEETQTIAPTNLSASAISTSSIRVSWTPITYTGDTGGYRVYCSTTSGSPWTYMGMTADKSASYYDVTGLSPGTTYYVVIKTQTNTHDNNDNVVISEYSEEASATTNQGGGIYTIELNRSRLDFASVVGSNISKSQELMITGNGGVLNWTATGDVSWLSLNPSSGMGSAIITVTINPSWLKKGTYAGTITVSDPNAVNSPQTVSVILKMYISGSTKGPFGTFETPIDGSTVSSSIPVTGWALDDIGVESVKIYRENDVNMIYIGDGVFVEGARPDVEQAYPGYPMNYQAGWGYMMLTNFLPNGGNGTFTLHAIASDTEGNTITLGTKTIICDNANAVKPFGAIDTPIQGGTVSGSSYRNQGWVLTPYPNSIPTDGSTINVYIDGINLGHPTYNIYRSDIAALFPGYANSNGAHAYFDFDTTFYTNGLHSISWTATDDAGNVDGIGSRYFSIQNTGSGSGASSKMHITVKTGSIWSHEYLSNIPVNDSDTIEILKGHGKNVEPQRMYPNVRGEMIIEIKELERLEIHFFDIETENTAITKKSILNISSLPIGSTLDTKKGVFYWQPGAGFIGEYQFAFIEKWQNGKMYRKNITIRVVPKFTCTNDTR